MTVTPGRRDREHEVAELLEDVGRVLGGDRAGSSTLACAWAGMIVFVPAPWKPPHRPLTSSVGRVARRSSVE